MNLKNYFFLMLFMFYTIGLKAQTSTTPLAELVRLEHTCGAATGLIEFGLLGDPEDFSYYWTHGPVDLILENLEPGIYTFVVKDLYGCQEEHEVEVLDITACEIQYEVTDGLEPCIKVINLQLLSNGTPIPEESLHVEWEDGTQAGMTRYVNTNYIGGGAIYCVEVAAVVDNDVCCNDFACIYIFPSPECYEGFTGGGNSGKDELKLYPNPFEENLTVNFYSEESGESTLSIYSATGSPVLDQKLETVKGEQSITLEALDKLTPGIYFLKFHFPSGHEIVKKITHANKQ